MRRAPQLGAGLARLQVAHCLPGQAGLRGPRTAYLGPHARELPHEVLHGPRQRRRLGDRVPAVRVDDLTGTGARRSKRVGRTFFGGGRAARMMRPHWWVQAIAAMSQNRVRSAGLKREAALATLLPAPACLHHVHVHCGNLARGQHERAHVPAGGHMAERLSTQGLPAAQVLACKLCIALL